VNAVQTWTLDFGLWSLGTALRAAALAAICCMPLISCASGKPAPSAARSDRAALLPAGGKPVQGALQDLGGQPVQLADLRGHPVLLDFFATWCEPCRLGLPRTDALTRARAPRGLVGAAISIDDELEPVGPFTQKLGLTLPVRWDRGAKVADSLGVEILPAVILLDASGALRYRASADDPEFDRHLEDAVDALLDEAPPAGP